MAAVVDVDHLGGPVRVDDLDRESALWFLEEAAGGTALAERRTLRAVTQWCHVNQLLDTANTSADAASWGEVVPGGLNDPEPIGGDGRPHLAAFSAEPLALALGISTPAALSWMADALELEHRLPRVHHRVEALEVPVWRARQVARATASLSIEAAAWVDQQVAPRAHRVGAVAIDNLVTQALALFDPDTIEAEEDTAEARWDVRTDHPTETGPAAGTWRGTSWTTITGDTTTLSDLQTLVDQVAHDLLATHPDLSLGQRRIQALQVVVDRARAHAHAHRDGPDADHPYRLFLHLDVDADGTVAPMGRAEGFGPVSTRRIRTWLTGSRVHVQPTLIPDRADTIDAHDPPAWMREHVITRDGHCVFPHCRRDARSCDLDHLIPYVPPDEGGPPGQTRLTNLAPLCRRHHRAKTTTDLTRQWRYTRTTTGHYAWTGPDDQRYVVVPHLGTYQH